MADAHPYFTYTREILSWRLGDQATQPSRGGDAPSPDPARTAVRAGRIVRAAGTHREVLLLGLGTGDLAAVLADALPPETSLTVLCPDTVAAARLRDAGGLAWARPAGNRQLLADASRQALFCLPAMTAQLGPQTLVTVNPEPCPPEIRQSLVWLRRMLADVVSLPEPAKSTAPAPAPVTLAVLARPDEPALPDFFGACAGLAPKAVIVWDAPDVPARGRDAAARLGMPARHLARPLGGDFAAQRNALLAACPPGLVLSLDPDERPGPGFRETLSRLAATPGLGGAYFPRLTLYPDPEHVKAGYGLWPDLQLRLFAHAPPTGPRYVRPVHERLEGLAGPVVLALDAPLLHLNRLLADDAAVTAKLAAYDAAAGRQAHHFSRDYPALPREFFAALAATPQHGRVLLLPGLW
ncbi:conserved hypothetical protein [Solidesulfovibrio fructosivorans JJ]]|uniref:Glycosyl transferase family 2 n=1 Tax=Solidesulfovibrio fructosivorans JJ] TaxID=596151 RepID=E1JSF1_SOLFR|nr:hypothetical protein [Solidesulfovibrio fructosivorans]EFL52920.1 conserved hypothetical protein [Solidesulfovibrio fructosivorans JJ]]